MNIRTINTTWRMVAALATAICTMSAVLADVALATDLDSYLFRYDFSSGAKVFCGSTGFSVDPLSDTTLSSDRLELSVLPIDGPDGANTAAHPMNTGWSAGSSSANSMTIYQLLSEGDWTFAMSVRPGTTHNGVLFSMGRRSAKSRKGISICASSNPNEMIVDENINNASGTKSQRSCNVLNNGVDVSRGFHTVVIVYRKPATGNAGTAEFYIDGVYQKSIVTANYVFGGGFQFCTTISNTQGSEKSTDTDLDVAFRDVRFYPAAFTASDAKKYAALYPADKMRPSAAVRAYGVNYVNTEYCVQPSTRIVADFQFTALTEQYRIFGSSGDTGDMLCFFYISHWGNFARCLHNNGTGWGDFELAANTRRGLVSLDSPNNSAKLYQDGVETTTTLGGSASNTGTIPLALFAQCEADLTVTNNSKSLIYSVGLQENGTPVHFFAPATNALGAAGFKDVITGNFKGEGAGTPSTALAYFDGVGCADDYKYEGGTLYAKCYAYSADARMGGVKFGTESASASTSAWIAYGGEATLAATQVWGYKFTGWTGDTWAIKSGSASDATITVSCDRAAQLQANYIRCNGLMIIFQ